MSHSMSDEYIQNYSICIPILVSLIKFKVVAVSFIYLNVHKNASLFQNHVEFVVNKVCRSCNKNDWDL